MVQGRTGARRGTLANLEIRKLEPGLVVADRFRLERELGRGGMGAVWLAHHVALDIPCAVKFIIGRALHDAAGRARFKHEAQAAAKLRSPNVVQILDHGIWESVPYIAMELLEGETLADRLDREGQLSLGETSKIVGGVARALSRAEELSIVHRDLKPENIFIVRGADGEQIKVLDFGVAKLAPSDEAGVQTKSGVLMGTPHYMSPEQAHGARSIDHRSDLWALGVIAYECATGELPFAGTGLGEVMQGIMNAPLPVPSRVSASLGPGFDAWWARAAARDPEARFQSARELAEALGDLAAASSGALDRTLQAPAAEGAPSSTPGRAAGGLERTLDGHATGAVAPGSVRWRVAIVAVLFASALGAWWALRGSGAAATVPSAQAPSSTAMPPAKAVQATRAERALPAERVATAQSTAPAGSSSASAAEIGSAAGKGARPASAPARAKPTRGQAPGSKPAPDDLQPGF